MSRTHDIANNHPLPAPWPREATTTLSGLDRVRAMRDGRFGVAPMQALMNMRLIEAEDGLVVFTASPGETHYNPQGTVHGAFTAAVLEFGHGPCRRHQTAGRRRPDDA